MILKSVELVNFRCHEKVRQDFEVTTTQILGPNGCGKTSILEAVYLACQGRSFKAADGEILRRGAEFYRVRLEFCDGREVVAIYDGNLRKFRVDGEESKRMKRVDKYPVVLFDPDDLHLVAASPARRRDYFDRFIATLDEGYASALSRYNKALRQRNELLKSPDIMEEMVFSWDMMLAKYGAGLSRQRARFVEKLNERLTEVYRTIAENEDRIILKYDSGVDGRTEEEFLRMLAENFERDRILGHSTIGVQRDNYVFEFNDEEADGSASRGETRSMILAMKFIEAEMYEKVLGRKPVVLLDDVFSELDAKRQKCLAENFRDNQVVITGVS